MTLIFTVVASSFLVVVVLQYVLIRVMLPKKLSGMARTIISFLAAVSVNTIPFLYRATDRILDDLPWWHREFIVFP